jgi:putative NADPH-quinone reductase
MPNLAVRDIEPDHYQALIDEASENGRSLSAEVRNFAAEVAKRRKAKKTVADLKALRDRVNLTLPDGMTSLDLLREERDSW